MMATSGPDQYAAFVSYSHERDSAVAAAIQRALHNLARPWYRLRALRVFRDESSLGASAELGASIERALLNSTHLILLASRAAAESPWVGREVAFWCHHKQIDRLLVVLTEGDIVWDCARGDFAWPATTAIPTALAGVFADEPRYVDLRWVREDPDRMSLHDARFRICIADLAAPLHGVPKDFIIGEDVRTHRRARQLARAGVAAVVAVAVALTVLTNSATTQRAKASSARNRAESSEREALARQLAAESLAQPRSSLDTSLLLAVEAMRLGDTAVARHALTTALRRARGIAAVIRTKGAVSAVAYHSMTDRLALVDSHAVSSPDSVSVWSVAPYNRLWSVPLAGALSSVAFDGEGSKVIAITTDGVRFFDATTGTPSGALLIPLSATDVTTLAADGGVLAVLRPGERASYVDLWDLRKRLFVGRVTFAVATYDVELGLSRNGRYLVVRQAPGRVDVWRVGSRQPTHTIRSQESRGVVAVDDTGTNVAIAHANSSIEIWDVVAARLLISSDRLSRYDGNVVALEFSPDASAVAASSRTHTDVWGWVGDLRRRRAETVPDWARRRVVIFPKTVHVMESAADRPDRAIYVFPGREDFLRHMRPVSLVPTGAHRALAAGDALTVLLDTTSGTALRTFPPMRALVGDDQGQTLAYYGADRAGGSELLLSTDAGASATPVSRLGGSVQAFAMSANGAVLAVGVAASSGATHVVVRDIRTRRDIAVLKGWDGGGTLLSGQVNRSISISADGTAVAFSNGSGVTLWRRDRVEVLPAAPGVVTKVELSHDATLLAMNDSEGYIEVLDTTSMLLVGQVLAGDVTDLAFSPDRHTLATAGSSDVSLWNLDTFEGRDVLPLGGGATTIAFDSQGGTLLAGNMSGTVNAWSLDTTPNIAAACAIVGRNLDSVETQQYFGRSEIKPGGCVDG